MQQMVDVNAKTKRILVCIAIYEENWIRIRPSRKKPEPDPTFEQKKP